MIQTSDKSITQITNSSLCIGCGVCRPACPEDAISILLTTHKEFQPIVCSEKCTNCGICMHVCPMQPNYLAKKINRATKQKSQFGLKEASFKVGFQINQPENYQKSSSGGVLSALLVELLESKKIDAVIHAKQVEGNDHASYFEACISTTSQEINDNRSSFYAAIEFSKVLDKIEQRDELTKIAFVGTPCVISSVKKLTKINEAVRSKIIFLFALVCGHNVNGQFADHISNYISDSTIEKRKLKFRDKIGIKIASDFNNTVIFADGTKKVVSRFKTPFTKYWRMNAYGLNGCNYCPDFWGEDADASFKDAWGIQLIKNEGETAFAVKNQEIKSIINKMENDEVIYTREISLKKFATSQERTYFDKTDYIESRAIHHPDLRDRITKNHNITDRLIIGFIHRLKSHVQNKSKSLFVKEKVYPAWKLPIFEAIIEYWEKFLLIKRRYKSKSKPTPEVIYTAGFGYHNIGDEAQLATNLQLWKKLAPEYKITLLSPNPDLTRKIHGNYDILSASRTSFFGITGYPYLALGETRYFYLYYWLRKQVILFSALTMKYLNRAPLLGPESAVLLKRLKKADLLHVGGGGLFTGKTQSRLYDLSFLIKIAWLLDTDIILSGHNIGIYNNFRQKNALKRLNKAKLIGLRDSSDSIEALKELNLYDEDKVIPLFDDALFFDALSPELFAKELEKRGIDPLKKYFAVNCYFGKNSEKQAKEMLSILAQYLKEFVRSNNFEVLLVPMDHTDLFPLEHLNFLIGKRSTIIQHDDDAKFVASIYRNAYATITTRHHPIIFSMGGSTPVISIVFEEYFKHKNIGALKLFNLEDYVIRFDENFKDLFERKISTLVNQYSTIQSSIALKMDELAQKKGFIIKKYLDSTL